MSPGRESRPGANRAATSQRLGIDNDEDTPTGRQPTGDAPPAVRPSALTQGEASTLDRCEQTIDKGITSFVEVGTALLQIREDRLYRTTYRTFGDYIKARFPQLSRSSVYRAIDTATVVQIVSPMGDIPNERQARELAPLRDEPEAMRQAWQSAVEQTDGRPTATAVRERVGAAARSTLDGPSVVPAPARQAHRKPLPDAFWHATHDALKVAERLLRLTADDRFTANRDAISARHRVDVDRAIKALTEVRTLLVPATKPAKMAKSRGGDVR